MVLRWPQPDASALGKPVRCQQAIANYTTACGDDQIFMPTCFSCARRFPHVASLGAKNEIRWGQALDTTGEVKFFGMHATPCKEILRPLDAHVDVILLSAFLR